MFAFTLFSDETFDFRGLKINYVFSILTTVFKNRFFFFFKFNLLAVWPVGSQCSGTDTGVYCWLYHSLGVLYTLFD